MNILTKTMARAAIVAAVGFFAASAFAQNAPATPAAAAAGMSDGEVRKVDKENKKLTLKHGPLANLDMPAMTMVFQVQDAAALDKLQPGDKVRFMAEKIDGKYTVTRIEQGR
jgi:Cu/Ag efflux protein CusF